MPNRRSVLQRASRIPFHFTRQGNFVGGKLYTLRTLSEEFFLQGGLRFIAMGGHPVVTNAQTDPFSNGSGRWRGYFWCQFSAAWANNLQGGFSIWCGPSFGFIPFQSSLLGEEMGDPSCIELFLWKAGLRFNNYTCFWYATRRHAIKPRRNKSINTL